MPLALQSVRLKPGEAWAVEGEGVLAIFLTSGEARYGLGPAVQQLGSGDLLVVNASAGGKLWGEGKVSFRYFSVCADHLVPLVAGTEIGLLQSLTDLTKQPRVFTATSVLARKCYRLLKEVPAEVDLQHRSVLLRIMAAILAEFKRAEPQRAGFLRADEHLFEVLESLSLDELLNSSVEDLAARFGFGRRHLNRLFQQHFGFSVGALKMELRLLKAASLLREPGSKVIAVAEQCGFNHLGLFNTCFRRRFQTSPGEWRKQVASVEGQPDVFAQVGVQCQRRADGLCPWGK